MDEKTSIFPVALLRDAGLVAHPHSEGIGQIPESGMNEGNTGHNGSFDSKDTIEIEGIVLFSSQG
jgi:hypothetical protein